MILNGFDVMVVVLGGGGCLCVNQQLECHYLIK